jgi:antitoxin Phd
MRLTPGVRSSPAARGQPTAAVKTACRCSRSSRDWGGSVNSRVAGMRSRTRTRTPPDTQASLTRISKMVLGVGRYSSWAVHDATARFSELMDACLEDGPQMVTRLGAEAAVLVPVTYGRVLLLRPGPRRNSCCCHGRAQRRADPARRRWPPAPGRAAALRLASAVYLLDTNVACELRQPRPYRTIVAWLQSVDESALRVSAVTWARFKLASS